MSEWLDDAARSDGVRLLIVVGPACLAAEERELPGASVSLSIREQKAMTSPVLGLVKGISEVMFPPWRLEVADSGERSAHPDSNSRSLRAGKGYGQPLQASIARLGLTVEENEDELPGRSAGQQGSASSAPRLPAENGSPDADQSRAATRSRFG